MVSKDSVRQLFNTPPATALFWRQNPLEQAVALHAGEIVEDSVGADLPWAVGCRIHWVKQEAPQPG